MKTFIMGLFAVVVACALLSTSAHAQAQYFGRQMPNGSLAQLAASRNVRGLQWALSMRGQVVGGGECTDLVTMHLAYSGAVPGDFSDEKNYIWGAVPGGYLPGDVIQFEGCYFKWVDGNSWGDFTMDHHTAIIASLKGNELQLLHQNGGGGGGPVVLETLNLGWMQRGTYKVWRPVPQ